MTDDERRFLQFYETYRRQNQSDHYRKRYETYEEAHRQSVSLTAIVLFLSAVVSMLSAVVKDVAYPPFGYHIAWSVWAAVLAAAGTAIAAYRTLYGFQENAGLYRDAYNALAFVGADSPDACEGCPQATVRTPADYLPLVEQVFRREQGQWGQLVAQTRAVGKAPEAPGAALPPGAPAPGPAGETPPKPADETPAAPGQETPANDESADATLEGDAPGAADGEVESVTGSTEVFTAGPAVDGVETSGPVDPSSTHDIGDGAADPTPGERPDDG